MSSWFHKHRLLTLLFGVCFLAGYSHQLSAQLGGDHHSHCADHCHPANSESHHGHDHEDSSGDSGEAPSSDCSCLSCLAAPGIVEMASTLGVFHRVVALVPVSTPLEAELFALKIERPPDFA